MSWNENAKTKTTTVGKKKEDKALMGAKDYAVVEKVKKNNVETLCAILFFSGLHRFIFFSKQ